MQGILSRMWQSRHLTYFFYKRQAEDLPQLQQTARSSCAGDEVEAGAVGPPGSAAGNKGVLSGAATWLAQRVRTSGGGDGGAADSLRTSGLGFTNMCAAMPYTLDYFVIELSG